MKKVLLALLVFIFCPVFILAADKIEINTASLQQLDQLVGIGPTIAQRIIDARPYSSIDGLLNVKGIGEKTLQEIKNQDLAYVLNQEPAPTPAPVSASADPEPVITYPTGIVISEILPSPDGPDETNEYIELYNTNAMAVDISGWKIKDNEGTSITYVFSQDLKIPANGYLVLYRPQTKILLNNDQDSISLLFPDDKIADTISYNNAPNKQSYNKAENSWKWSASPTPGIKNNTTQVAKALPKPKKTDNKVSMVKVPIDELPTLDKDIFTASLNQSASNPWWLFIIAAIITMASGILFLILKLIIFKKHVRP